MTLSFHKVNFTAQEVLEIAEDIPEHYDNGALAEFIGAFVREAEKRSREYG